MVIRVFPREARGPVPVHGYPSSESLFTVVLLAKASHMVKLRVTGKGGFLEGMDMGRE